ncbi:uncharacterized protein [Ambystoma mexicanum]|uniref:uncharacterized protein n=1 Tax=Ambystoma mexicanum TaxID=8296 RepID=UPI0037E9AC0C
MRWAQGSRAPRDPRPWTAHALRRKEALPHSHSEQAVAGADQGDHHERERAAHRAARETPHADSNPCKGTETEGTQTWNYPSCCHPRLRVHSEGTFLQVETSLLLPEETTTCTIMAITVQNVTDSTAMVIWPLIYGCADTFYSLLYHPNWNSMFSAHSRKDFQKEERVPGTRTSFVIEDLTPLTTYILCVTCQSANPSSDQCQVFNTLTQDPASANSKKKDLPLGIWLTSSILLLIIACILLYGCLHIWCRKRRQKREDRDISSEQDKGEKQIKKKKTPEGTEKVNQPVLNNEECNVDSNHPDMNIENPWTNLECATLHANNQEPATMAEHATSEV